MRILGIDTSGKVAAAALYDSEAGCLLAQQSVYTKRTHSQVILPLAERLLADTGLQWQDVDGFAVAKVADGEDFGPVRADSPRWIITAGSV